MPVVVVGRLVSGAGEALIDVSLLVLVARVLPSQLRPRMFSLVSAAWILPSVVGPVVTGVVTEQLGWRWVFLGVLVLVGPTWLLLRPALDSAPWVSTSPVPGGPGPRLGWATLAGGGVLVLTLAGEHLSSGGPVAWLVLVLSAVVLFVSVVRLLPAGTLRGAPGLPAVVAVRGPGQPRLRRCRGVPAAAADPPARLPAGHGRHQPDGDGCVLGVRLVASGP